MTHSPPPTPHPERPHFTLPGGSPNRMARRRRVIVAGSADNIQACPVSRHPYPAPDCIPGPAPPGEHGGTSRIAQVRCPREPYPDHINLYPRSSGSPRREYKRLATPG